MRWSSAGSWKPCHQATSTAILPDRRGSFAALQSAGNGTSGRTYVGLIGQPVAVIITSAATASARAFASTIRALAYPRDLLRAHYGSSRFLRSQKSRASLRRVTHLLVRRKDRLPHPIETQFHSWGGQCSISYTVREVGCARAYAGRASGRAATSSCVCASRSAA